jgi:UMF1 family MFS transporter
MLRLKRLEKSQWSWALYDWANSAFATTVMGVFFPIMFKTYWSADSSVAESTWRLGATNSAASLVVALLSPVMGAIADKASVRKRFLIYFAMMGVVMTGGLALAAKGSWELAALLYFLASIGFAGGNTFYDSMIVGVSNDENVDLISALGYSLGYLGGGILFAVNVVMVSKPHLFGLADAAEAVKVSFFCVSLWWGGFSLPLILFVKEPENSHKATIAAAIGLGVCELWQTLKGFRDHRQVVLFLLAYWLYIDGVDTVIRMAVDYGMSLGFASESLMIAFLITQFVGFPAALFYSKLGERIGPKTAVMLGLAVYVGVVFWGYRMNEEADFYILAVVVGLVQGGVQALSRSIYVRLIPAGKSAEFFGFYNMLGKTAAILGPLLMGAAAMLTGNPRMAIIPILILFALGGALLALVKVPESQLEVEG